MPFQILGIWFRGLVALVLLGVGIFLVGLWYRDIHRVDVRVVPAPQQEADNDRHRNDEELVERPVLSAPWFGFNKETAYFLGGLALILWSCGLGSLSTAWLGNKKDTDPPRELEGGDVRHIARPDGSELHVRMYGPADAMPVVLLHGWGLDSNEWTYATKEIANRSRLVVWDLPGFGNSTSPKNKDWSLEKLAGDLDAVLESLGEHRAIVAGHSIGGMIILTHCRLFPDTVRERVAALVLGQTTYTNPVKTTSKAALYTALQKPLLEPLCHLMVWLAPLVWLLNWLSYMNGSAHRSNHNSFFSGNETRQQLNFITQYYIASWPGVVARGMLGMFRFDAADMLSSINIPTFIIAGEKDSTCVPEASTVMKSLIPQSEMHTIVSAGHGGVFEFHQQFAGTIHKIITVLGEPSTSRHADSPRQVEADTSVIHSDQTAVRMTNRTKGLEM